MPRCLTPADSPEPILTHKQTKNYSPLLEYLKKKMDGEIFSTRHFEGKRRPNCMMEIEGLSFSIKINRILVGPCL